MGKRSHPERIRLRLWWTPSRCAPTLAHAPSSPQSPSWNLSQISTSANRYQAHKSCARITTTTTTTNRAVATQLLLHIGTIATEELPEPNRLPSPPLGTKKSAGHPWPDNPLNQTPETGGSQSPSVPQVAVRSRWLYHLLPPVIPHWTTLNHTHATGGSRPAPLPAGGSPVVVVTSLLVSAGHHWPDNPLPHYNYDRR
jgi:hypothetical protein